MKIIADKNIPFLKDVVEAFGDVSYLAGADFTKENIKDAEVLIVRTIAKLGAENLEGSKVKLICSATIGYDHIDTEYCKRHNIAWCNAPGCNSGSVQQYIASMLIVISRMGHFNLADKTIGIVGLGNVGQKVAIICQLLGMRVLKNDPIRQENETDKNKFVDISVIQQEADFITFHTPLSKTGKYATYHLADSEFFGKVKKCPIIINSARGGIIDTDSIKMALDQKLISGAIIDCWENEPNIDLEYLKSVDIATPHIAGYSADGKANATRMSLESLAKFYSLSQELVPLINIPQVADPVIDYSLLDTDTNRFEEIILKTYNPYDDWQRLINDPTLFTQYRANYPLRREYKAYTITNLSDSSDKEKLQNLGFNII